MEELNENNALFNQMRELVSRFELQARREEMARNFSAREPSFQHGFYPPFQQLDNSYPQEQHYFSAQDQVYFQNSDFVLDSYNSACGDAYPYFQQQEVNSYPQPYAHMPCSDFQQVEQGYYPHDQVLESQQWSCYDPTPSPNSAATFDAIMEALKPSTAAGFSKEEGNKEEEENSLLVVNSRHSGQEAEKLEISTSAGKFRIGEELNEEETKLIFSLLSAHYKDEIQQQKEEEKVEKKLNSDHDSSLRLKGKEATTRYDFTCAGFDSLLQGKHYLVQHSESENQEKEGEKEDKSFPQSPLLRSLVERDVEDFTCEDSDHLLHEESHTMAAQNQLQEEKQEEEAKAPSLQHDEAAELHSPQSTTPMHKEEEAAYPLTVTSFSLEFELTPNQFFLALNVFISGDRLISKQLNLNEFCKLQSKALFGEVCKRGTNGDGVLWNIKVHPP